MDKYGIAQIAVMKNGSKYDLKFLANITSSQERDNLVKAQNNFVTALSIGEEIPFRRVRELTRLANQGLDYLVQELS